jgi:hypothetical protein
MAVESRDAEVRQGIFGRAQAVPGLQVAGCKVGKGKIISGKIMGLVSIRARIGTMNLAADRKVRAPFAEGNVGVTRFMERVTNLRFEISKLKIRTGCERRCMQGFAEMWSKRAKNFTVSLPSFTLDIRKKC